MLAKKWVEKNKVNKKLDKTADDYVQHVLLLISSGSSDRLSGWLAGNRLFIQKQQHG